MLPTKFRFIWPSSFRGEDFKKSANQKQESPVVAMFINGYQLTIFFPENTWSNDTTVSYYCHWTFQKYIQQSCMLSKRAAVTKNRKFIKVVKILHGELECNGSGQNEQSL
jgi:hypothetical protein